MRSPYGRFPGPGDLGLAELARLEAQQDDDEADESMVQIPPGELYDDNELYDDVENDD